MIDLLIEEKTGLTRTQAQNVWTVLRNEGYDPTVLMVEVARLTGEIEALRTQLTHSESIARGQAEVALRASADAVMERDRAATHAAVTRLVRHGLLEGNLSPEAMTELRTAVTVAEALGDE